MSPAWVSTIVVVIAVRNVGFYAAKCSEASIPSILVVRMALCRLASILRSVADEFSKQQMRRIALPMLKQPLPLPSQRTYLTPSRRAAHQAAGAGRL